MRKKKVIMDYSGINDHEFNTLIGKVVDCLEGHHLLTDLPISLEEINMQVEDFKIKWQKASRGGSILERSEKNDSKQILVKTLRSLSFYVNTVAEGSRSILLSSGLVLERDSRTPEVPGVLLQVALIDGKQQNQLQVKFKSQPYALIYEYEITSQLDGFEQPLWQESFQTSTSYGNVFSPTTAGVTYYMRVRARNKHGIGDWSEVVRLMAR
ncbi:hypothetical protein GEO21_00680 [Sphingobacterium faecium]|uniref:fibronectin type III domain-containing protein n=1 Tax=Sphingobacterium faecium TaxID=34087 RepID=UPI001291139F|nr:fibronectin type III domain-containing protein [Sphingobacterium faecium]MQP26026.1 hypothetical protein [Sphingobacterium faecium]